MEVSIDPLGGWSQGSQLRPSGRRCDDEVLPPRAPAGPSPLPTEDGLRGERPARRSRWMPYRLPGFGAEPGRDGVPELDAVQVAEPAVVARPSVCREQPMQVCSEWISLVRLSLVRAGLGKALGKALRAGLGKALGKALRAGWARRWASAVLVRRRRRRRCAG